MGARQRRLGEKTGLTLYKLAFVGRSGRIECSAHPMFGDGGRKAMNPRKGIKTHVHSLPGFRLQPTPEGNESSEGD